MKTVSVKASSCYNVLIGRSILGGAAHEICGVRRPNTAAVITDDTVDALYSPVLISELQAEGIETVKFVFPHGESSKNIGVFGEILEFLASNRLTRSDLVIALGGGVVGDIAGFAASCYLRGIDCVQIPTTFLATIDSSVGGKTAIDLAAGKNLAGAFCQPKLVLCDLDTLNTLPPHIFADGSAEAIKYGMIASTPLFDLLRSGSFEARLEEIVESCVSIKAGVVAADEFDTGGRQILNFGHTIGHAVERLSGYAVSHGHAVAIGMAVITRAALKLGRSGEDCITPLLTALEACSLPSACEYSAEALYEAALADKKRSGDSITVVLPRRIGECYLQKMPVGELLTLIKAGLE